MPIQKGQWVKITQHPIYQNTEGRVISIDEYGDFATIRLYDEDAMKVAEIDVPATRLQVLDKPTEGEG
jgi:hypothetical protein